MWDNYLFFFFFFFEKQTHTHKGEGKWFNTKGTPQLHSKAIVIAIKKKKKSGHTFPATRKKLID